MSWTIYHSAGLILGSSGVGEAGRQLEILTPDFGLVSALATGSRYGHSKLRGHLVDYTFIDARLLRGRERWRLVGAARAAPFFPPADGAQDEAERWRARARLARLLRRLIQGERPEPGLFADIKAALTYLADRALVGQALRQFELLLALRVLEDLGYFSRRQLAAGLLDFKNWTDLTLPLPAGADLPLAPAVTMALARSHL
jgi:recombinational DNA repair protein (RecF pathway)